MTIHQLLELVKHLPVTARIEVHQGAGYYKLLDAGTLRFVTEHPVRKS